MRSRVISFRSRRELNRFSNIANPPQNGLVHITKSPIDSDTSQLDENHSENDHIQRSKRETSDCVVNYNSVRQLFVGCSQSNIIEVKPHCNDDGDEGKHCIKKQLFQEKKIDLISFVCLISLYSIRLSRLMD